MTGFGSTEISKSDIVNAINTLGISGADVCIHSSMRSFGAPMKNGLKSITDAFMERFCTIMVPTFSDIYEVRPTKQFMPEQNGAGDYSFFLEQSYAEVKPFTVESKEISAGDMGAFPKFVLESEGSVRGNNPLNSFTALGTNAKRLVGRQSFKDVYAPLKQLCADDGYVLLMGVGLDKATIIHYAEQVAGRVPFVRWAYDENRKVVPVSAGSCSEGFRNLDGILDIYARKITVGSSRWVCYKAQEFVDICSRAIRNMPNITHCDDKECDRCNDAIKGGPQLPADFWTKGL
ncbi:MAG: AAC(3) family N-acetyltransferase [Ruminococcus sp.]|nr:AAC(3) family N-acetyltransferase [Ruminococcus sp.]